MKESEQGDGFAVEERGSVERISTPDRHAWAELERELERLRLVTSNLRDYAIIGIDQKHLISSWSEGARRVLGWDEREILGRPAGTFFTPEDV
jgi:PAS domain-containing protein